MSKKNSHAETAGDKVPASMVKLDGDIVTAAKSTMIGKSYEEGYPIEPSFKHMENVGGKKK